MPHETDLSRRRFIQATGGTLAAGLLTQADSLSADQEARPLVIDCHAHIYSEDEETYPTIAEPNRPPQGTGTIAHLKREMQAAGVRYVTAVQTSSFYRWDNRFTTDSSLAHKDFMVGVCTLDPDDGNSPALLERYVRDHNVRGMRSLPAHSGLFDDPGVDKLWETAERLGIVINVLVGRDKKTEVETLVARHPRLPVVIDHCFNLAAGPELAPTLEAMVSLARFSTIHAKLTFIPTGTAQEYPCRDMHDACREVIAAFGSRRCVWGSNFPCELWCPEVSYAQHLRIFTHELGLDSATKKAILGETAHRLWFQ